MACLSTIPFELLEQILHQVPIDGNVMEMLLMSKWFHSLLSLGFAERHFRFQRTRFESDKRFLASLVSWHTLPCIYQAAFYGFLLVLGPTGGGFQSPLDGVLRKVHSEPRFRKHAAIRKGLKKRFDVHVFALLVASRSGHASVVKALVATVQDSHPNPRDVFAAALRSTCSQGSAHTARMLCATGVEDERALFACATLGHWEMFFDCSTEAVRKDNVFINRVFTIALRNEAGSAAARLYDLGCIDLAQHDDPPCSPILPQVAALGISKAVADLLASDDCPNQLNLALLAASSSGQNGTIEILLNEFKAVPSLPSLAAAFQNGHVSTVQLFLADPRFVPLLESNHKIWYDAAQNGGKPMVEAICAHPDVSATTKCTLVLLLALLRGESLPTEHESERLNQVTASDIETILAEFGDRLQDFPRMLENACHVNKTVLVSSILQHCPSSAGIAAMENIQPCLFRDDQVEVTRLLLSSGIERNPELSPNVAGDMFLQSCTAGGCCKVAEFLFLNPSTSIATTFLLQAFRHLFESGQQDFAVQLLVNRDSSCPLDDFLIAAQACVLASNLETFRWFLTDPRLDMSTHSDLLFHHIFESSNPEILDLLLTHPLIHQLPPTLLDSGIDALLDYPRPETTMILSVLNDPRVTVTQRALRASVRTWDTELFTALLRIDPTRVQLVSEQEDSTYETPFAFFEEGLYESICIGSHGLIDVWLQEWLIPQRAPTQHARILGRALQAFLEFDVPFPEGFLTALELTREEFRDAYLLCVATMGESYQRAFEEDVSISTIVGLTVAQAPTTNMQTGCVTNYDATIDYFPEKIDSANLTNLAYTYSKHYKTIVNKFSNETIVLYQCGTPKPTVAGASQIISVPIQNLTLGDTTIVPYLEFLNQRQAIKFSTDGTLSFVTSPCIQEMVAKDPNAIIEADSKNATHQIEQVGSTNVYFNYMGSISANVTNSVTFPASADPGVEGRVEWIGFLGSFFNQEFMANNISSTILTNYAQLAAAIPSTTTKPSLSWVTYQAAFSADYPAAWQINQAAYQQDLTTAAGATIFTPPTSTNPTITGQAIHQTTYTYPTSTALLSAITPVDLVIDLSFYDTNITSFLSSFTIASTDTDKYKFLSNKAVYMTNREISPTNGGTNWLEAAVLQNNIVLADLISITNPSVLAAGYQPTFLRNAFTQAQVILTASQCKSTTEALAVPVVGLAKAGGGSTTTTGGGVVAMGVSLVSVLMVALML
ncbi:hypothetical protein HDU98_002460 [Podochytrium sp. JEL0797]|nr:hypothetical protein HDU98_002460 [Podochytrium sp. JEL0797]